MIELNYSTVEDREHLLDVRKYQFEEITDISDFIRKEYKGKDKRVVFIILLSSEHNDANFYFVTDSWIFAFEYIEQMKVVYNGKKVTLFEEYTYSDAFDYCKDHCEVHELGLENKYLNN